MRLPTSTRGICKPPALMSSRGPGLMGVNGPPGTGKTTMLRDILASNVVERARRLPACENPLDAFTERTHEWTGEGRTRRRVRKLWPEVVGFEMVVAPANNAAVENISEEIPQRSAIKDGRDVDADYFACLATAALGGSRAEEGTLGEDRSTSEQPGTSRLEGRGLIAARSVRSNSTSPDRARIRRTVTPNCSGSASARTGPGARDARGRPDRPTDRTAQPWADSTSSSTQSRERSTAFFHSRRARSASSSSMVGSQRLSSSQLATSSSWDAQNPTARPAA